MTVEILNLYEASLINSLFTSDMHVCTKKLNIQEAAAKPTEDDGTRSSRRRRKRAKRNSSSGSKALYLSL